MLWPSLMELGKKDGKARDRNAILMHRTLVELLFNSRWMSLVSDPPNWMFSRIHQVWILQRPNLLHFRMKSAKGRNTTEVSQLPTILSMPEKVEEQPVGLHQFFIQVLWLIRCIQMLSFSNWSASNRFNRHCAGAGGDFPVIWCQCILEWTGL